MDPDHRLGQAGVAPRENTLDRRLTKTGKIRSRRSGNADDSGDIAFSMESRRCRSEQTCARHERWQSVMRRSRIAP
jgi:hypothetical protein